MRKTFGLILLFFIVKGFSNSIDLTISQFGHSIGTVKLNDVKSNDFYLFLPLEILDFAQIIQSDEYNITILSKNVGYTLLHLITGKKDTVEININQPFSIKNIPSESNLYIEFDMSYKHLSALDKIIYKKNKMYISLMI